MTGPVAAPAASPAAVAATSPGHVLDVAAVLDLAHAGEYTTALCYLATLRGHALEIPWTVLAEAFRQLDDVDAARLGWIVDTAGIVVGDVDVPTAIATAAAARRLGVRLPQAHVAAAAWSRGWLILTDERGADTYRRHGLLVDALP